MATRPTPPGEAISRMNALLQRSPAPLDEVLEFYDSLPPATVEQMRGAWTGRELPTGNPLDGLLKLYGWHGKRFAGPDETHPLVMSGRRATYSLNPAVIPVHTLVRMSRLLKNRVLAKIARALMPLFATKKPTARLRITEYRGVSTATMVYDALPINDHFRKVDEDTVLGAMDLRGLDVPFMFVLERGDSPRRMNDPKQLSPGQ